MSSAATRAAPVGNHRVAIALLATLLCLAFSAPAAASATQESLFQDDNHLVYASSGTVEKTLARVESLGVQRVRVTLKWSDVAPRANSRHRPGGFIASSLYPSDPAAYGRAWSPYDRLVKLAARHRVGVDFDITGPGPLWAMGAHPPTARAANHWQPRPADFYLFVMAAGRRYSGSYHSLPRVSYWSIWNEPNQPGWLAPQWTGRHKDVLDAARSYRGLALVAYTALYFTGHTPQSDTVLIGETAPEGSSARDVYLASAPMPFVRALYCVDGRYRPLRGAAAKALGCPASGDASAFAAANPDLFQSTGFAHHPYFFAHAPGVRTANGNFVPLADLDRLERGLDRLFGTYGVHRREPIYLTEYGYQTNPPDPHVNTSLSQQAAYLDQAEFMAFENPRVRSMAQFLLFDDLPDRHYRPNQFQYWSTFQTGLLFAGGRAKPAFAAYRIPIWLPHRQVRRGHSLLVWGDVRPANQLGAQRALVQWQPVGGGGWRTLGQVTTTVNGFLVVVIRPPASGALRIRWTPPGSRAALVSRSAAVAVR